MKRKDIAALIIGRGNNTLRDKNVLPVLGKPLLQWGGLAAIHSKYIGRYYISSDCEKILEAGKEISFKSIVRPVELAQPNSQSSDVVKHAYNEIIRDENIKIVVVIHANVGTISSFMIDECIEIMLENQEYSSVIPCHMMDEYHPLRAMKVNMNGYMIPFMDNLPDTISANRQELGECLFYDHSFWVLDVEKGILSENGQKPWPVMGNKIYPYKTQGCFDVHDLDDLKKTEEWIIKNKITEQYNKD